MHQVRFNNVSIQVNAENAYRVASTFFPPELQVSLPSLPPPAGRRSHCAPFRSAHQELAEICNSGYVDALRFLQENSKSWSWGGAPPPPPSPSPAPADLISSECPGRSLEAAAPPPCCEEAAEAQEPGGKQHRWLRPQLVEKLPVQIRKGEAGGWRC